MRDGQPEMSGLLAAQERFDAWRAQRERGARIPAELWSLAVEVASQYGLGRAVTALRLDYYSLKQRLLAAGHQVTEPQLRAPRGESKTARPERIQPRAATGGHEAFVQIPPLGMAPPSCRIELQTPAGANLRLELFGVSMVDTMLLTRAIWSQL
jgi:hypothetical protein